MQTETNRAHWPQQILKQIALQGYNQTSMQHIAQVIGVSRQAIYKRFKSKQLCYQWAIQAYLEKMYKAIFKALAQPTASPRQTLVAVFDTLILDALELVNQQYGKKVLDDALLINKQSEQDWTIRLVNRLGEFLFKHSFSPSLQSGCALSFVLIMAGKGVLLESNPAAQSRADIDTILEVTLSL